MESVIQSGEELLNRLIKLKEDDDLSRIGKLFRTNSNCYFYDTGTGKVVQMEQIVYELLEKFFAGKNETLIRSEELAEFFKHLKLRNYMIGSSMKNFHIRLIKMCNRLF